ncbi:MAG TPA: GGDEF domain-containing protein [Acidiferrobacteraceae bacterium]|nr:GGDEF domain-containing protein [Acidiferrobacteraceae bacterium]HEX20662.1 GGDEF domain-containing protein [Acidiferrobacteraceae bacterium]
MVQERNKRPSTAKYISRTVTKGELQTLWLFSGVVLDNVISMLNRCPIHRLSKNDILITQGDVNKSCYLLLSGSLSIHLDSRDSDPVTKLRVGESIGELSLIDGQPTSANVIANDLCEVLVLNEERFWTLVNASHAFSRNLLFLLARRLRDNNATISDVMKRQQKYERVSTTDELTGLHNRRWINDKLSRQIKRNQYNNEPLSLLMLDIDRFKSINDNYGHLVGDQVLMAVAEVMSNCIRPTDLVARYGGEEFIIVLPVTELAGAHIVADRVCKDIREKNVDTKTDLQLPKVTVSIGFAQLQNNESMENLVARADTALYQAKNNGRDRVEG